MNDRGQDRDVAEGLDEGIRQFNDEGFFECHDTWEAIWMGLRGRDRLFFHGLIQIAVGYYHLTCENYPGAEHLLARGIAKLEAFSPGHRGVDVADLLKHASTALSRTIDARSGDREPFGPDAFPKIRRTNRAPTFEVGQGLERG